MSETRASNLDQLPDAGFVFWPVGTGDSTTIVVDEETVMQVDLHHLGESDDDDSKRVPIIDELERLLPERDGEPYLAVFALTHPDQDHCRGFADVLERIQVGELWFTPRVFREYKTDLCDDAIAFQDEANRRVSKTISQGGDVASGDRVRIIGYDDLLQEDNYSGFPESRLTIPGNSVEELDGRDVSGLFRGFIHAPFKDDSTGDRNDTSLAIQVGLSSGGGLGRALMLGDLCYPTVRKIFTRSDDDDLEWNVMLAAHHCSKSVMYWSDEENGEEELKRDLLDDMDDASGSPGYVVASSDPVPATDEEGANPPHAKAKRRYEEIVANDFLCTQEHPSEEDPQPIVFEVDEDGLHVAEKDDGPDEDGGDDDDRDGTDDGKSLGAAVAAARKGEKPPTERVGFGAAT